MTFTTKNWINGQLVDAAQMTDLEARIAAYVDTYMNGMYKPSDMGMLAWTYDPQLSDSSTLLATAGTIYTVRLKLNAPISLTNIWISILNAGATLTSGQCFIGAYQGGTQIGTSADQATSWQSATMKTIPLVGGPFAVAAGDLIIAMYYNGTTAPGLARAVSYSPQVNLNLSAANSRYGSADTGRTTSLPGTLGTITAGTGPAYWVGIN